MARIADNRGEWFNIWLADRRSIQTTMLTNMLADLDAGYNPEGFSIRQQRVEIEVYTAATNQQIEQFKHMEDNAVDRWCFYDLKKRGAID